MAEGGIQKLSMRTELGSGDAESNGSSSTFDVVVKDHGMKAGLQYDSVCISPAVQTSYDDIPEKTVQVVYKEEPNEQGGLRFATLCVNETPTSVTDTTAIAKTVRLRSTVAKFDRASASKAISHKSGGAGSSTDQEGIFASDTEALKYVRFEPKHAVGGGASESTEQEGIFASDPEALKYVRFEPKHAVGGEASGSSEQEGIFASDPEALKYVRFEPKHAVGGGAGESTEQEGIFASDPEALKYVRFEPKHAVGGEASGSSEQEGIFASDPEALKYVRFEPKHAVGGGAGESTEQEGIFASDPEALKYVRFEPKHAVGGGASERSEGIFASDPEALKYARLAPERTEVTQKPVEKDSVFVSDSETLNWVKIEANMDGQIQAKKVGQKDIPASMQGSNTKMSSVPGAIASLPLNPPEGVFASDPEALKFFKFGPKQSFPASVTATEEMKGQIFASDPDAAKCVHLDSRPPTQSAVSTAEAFVSSEPALQQERSSGLRTYEGELLAEATGVELKDSRTYSVKVTGHDLPDGQRKKFVSVRSTDGRGGLSQEELDRMQVTVEEKVNEDGLVEKFIVVE